MTVDKGMLTARRFLDRCKPKRTITQDIKTMIVIAEGWGRRVGLGSHISPTTFIQVARELGFKVNEAEGTIGICNTRELDHMARVSNGF